MEKFKAVEKEMKTKAFSKEGLQAAAKMDPAEKAKDDACVFLTSMVEELERQIETLEAEEEALQATVKKGKKDTSKADRLSEISRTTERNKFHLTKLELLNRSLQNGNVETEQVQDLEESIRYYVEENQSVDFQEDDAIYDDLNLEDDEGAYGLNNEDRVSSQDAQSIADDLPETIDARGPSGGSKPKSTSVSEPQGTGVRRPSNQLKSPLPVLATLHTPLASTTNGTTNNAMKPAPLPTRAPGETLKYASAAAAAAANDKAPLGIAPLPPPPGTAAAPTPSAPPGLSANPPTQKSSTTASPSALSSVPASSEPTPPQKPAILATAAVDLPSSTQASDSQQAKHQVLIQTSPAAPAPIARNVPPLIMPDTISHSRTPSIPKAQPPAQPIPKEPPLPTPVEAPATSLLAKPPITEQTNGEPPRQEEESVYHLPPGLQDLLQSFEVTKNRPPASDSPSVQRLLAASHASRPDFLDAEKPRHYRPDTKYNTPSYYPQEPFPNSDDPSLYSKIDTDTLFYIFYYRQNTFQQYLAAKALKGQSWRFHKQYQTWFQRHEEPKTITEEFEQGTYRFFDYESTW